MSDLAGAELESRPGSSPDDCRIVATAPLLLGIAGAMLWIVGEAIELLAPGSALIQPVAGAGIVGTALLPFGLLLGQGRGALTLSYFGAFLMSNGAFMLGMMNLLGYAPGSMQPAAQFGLYDAGGAAYILGSFAFTAGLLINGRYRRLPVAGIGICAAVIIFMFAFGLPQMFASVSNIVLASLLIALAMGLLRGTQR